MASLGSGTLGTKERHRTSAQGNVRDGCDEVRLQWAEIPSFLSFSVVLLACQLFLHGDLKPKEIPTSSIYLVVGLKPLNRYLCPNNYCHSKKNTHKLKGKLLFHS